MKTVNLPNLSESEAGKIIRMPNAESIQAAMNWYDNMMPSVEQDAHYSGRKVLSMLAS